MGVKLWRLTLREECRLKVFENRVLRRIFGPKRDEGRGGWRRLHNEKLYTLYSSPDVIRMTKLRKTRLTENVARMGERKSRRKVLVGQPERRNNLENQGVDGRIIVKWIFEKWNCVIWIG
jgi:hypothetical protein